MPLRPRFPIALALGLALLASTPPARAASPFEDYEVRVIRPRYFLKSGRVELGAGLGSIVNQTFVYSVMATGLLTWHASETWAVELQGGYGTNVDREDQRRLRDHFDIRTVVLRPESLANARLSWTPSYGKFNVTSARIVYFDTSVTAGAGETGIRYRYDHCDDPKAPPPAARSVRYPTVLLGLGQRYFLDRQSSLRLGFEVQRFFADRADSACDSATERAIYPSDNLLFFIAWSYYL